MNPIRIYSGDFYNSVYISTTVQLYNCSERLLKVYEMKAFFIILVALFLVNYSAARPGSQDVSANLLKCEDILKPEKCKSMKNAAKKLGIKKAQVIDILVAEAFDKDLIKAIEVVKYVEQRLPDLAKDFKCEDVLSKYVCSHIRKTAEKLKIKKATVDKALKEMVAKDITSMKTVLLKLKEIFHPNTSPCEDLLGKSKCEALKKVAEKLKLKTPIIDKLVAEAFDKGLIKATMVAEHVKQRLTGLPKDFKCEDIFSKYLCDGSKVRKVVEKTTKDYPVYDYDNIIEDTM